MKNTIHIEIIGALIRTRGQDEFELTCDNGTTVVELLHELEYQNLHIPHILASVNGTVEKHGYVLRDGDKLVLSVIVGGG